MADDTLQTGGDTISTDHVTTLNGAAVTQSATSPKVQRVKVLYGDDNTARDVSQAFPLPTFDPDVTATGSLAALNATVALALNSQSAGSVQVTGTWVGTISFEGTVDGTTWLPINAVVAGTSGPVQSTTANGILRLTPGGLAQFRVNMTAFTSGSATITMRASAGTGGIFANQTLPVQSPAGTSVLVQGIAGGVAAPVSLSGALVKAASTAPVTTDQALVVSQHPLSTINGDTVVGPVSLAAGNAAATIPLNGQGSVVVQVTGTFSAGLNFEAQMPDSAWVQVNGYTSFDGAKANGIFSAAANARVNVAGFRAFRVRVNSYTSGTAVVSLEASYSSALYPLPDILMEGFANGDQRAGSLIFGHTPGTGGAAILKPLSFDSAGSLITTTADSVKTTYSASVSALAGAATDIFTITGSATKTIRVTRVSISGTQTTAGDTVVSLVKRSTANTAGTSSAVTGTPHDSNDAAPTATVLAYTVAPTLGTAVGTPLRSSKLFVATATGQPQVMAYDFGTHPGTKNVVLRGIAQVFAVNLAAALTGASYALDLEWTEE